MKTFNPATGNWENLGTMIGANSSATIFLNYNNTGQYFHDTLNTVIRPVVPGPGVISLAILAISVSTTTADLSFSNLISNRGYRIMRSAVLSGWEEAHRFTAASSTATWSEPLAPAGRMFYRLEWDE